MPTIIQYTGLRALEAIDQETVKNLSDRYLGKITQQIKNVTKVVYHIKQYRKSGKASKYSVRLRVIAPTHIFESSATEWELPKVTHMVYKEIINQIKRKLRTDEQK